MKRLTREKVIIARVGERDLIFIGAALGQKMMLSVSSKQPADVKGVDDAVWSPRQPKQ